MGKSTHLLVAAASIVQTTAICKTVLCESRLWISMAALPEGSVFVGKELLTQSGKLVYAETALADKNVVACYFSAHWCPPCRQFTPMLKDFYEEAEGIEIVFVSSDRSAEDMTSYMKESHGDWMAVEHNSAVANNLKQKYGVSGIPCLVVCKKDGTLVTKDGRAGVTSMPPAQAVSSWKK